MFSHLLQKPVTERFRSIYDDFPRMRQNEHDFLSGFIVTSCSRVHGVSRLNNIPVWFLVSLCVIGRRSPDTITVEINNSPPQLFVSPTVSLCIAHAEMLLNSGTSPSKYRTKLVNLFFLGIDGGLCVALSRKTEDRPGLYAVPLFVEIWGEDQKTRFF